VPIPTLLLLSITIPTPVPPPAARPKKSLAPALSCTPALPVDGLSANTKFKSLLPDTRCNKDDGLLVPIPTSPPLGFKAKFLKATPCSTACI